MTDATPLPAGLTAAEKRALLARLIRERSEPACPLSHGQRGMWLQAQRDLHSAALNIGFAARVGAPLDRHALRRTAQHLARRHPSLRATFETRRNELVQTFRPPEAVSVEEFDAAGWTDAAVRSRVEEEFHRPFDLVRGPLARTIVFHRGGNDDVLLVVLHHLVGDFWSLVILAEEWPRIYRCERLGLPLNLPQATGSYADFVAWQQQLLSGPDGRRLAEFWKSELAGMPTILDLPTDFPRPPRLSHRGALRAVRLDRRLVADLRELARKSGVTFYATLMAAYQVLIGQAAGQESFFVGSPFAGRTRPEFARVVGYFSNMLPVRADLADRPTVAQLLERVGRITLDVLAHQDYPFPLIVEAVALPRDPARTPFFQTTFTLEKSHLGQSIGAAQFMAHVPSAARNFGELELAPFPFSQRTSQADLSLLLEDAPDDVAGFFRYNTDLFSAETIDRLAGRWERILQAFVETPHRTIDALPIVSTEESDLLASWSAGPIRPRIDTTLSRLVARQAATTPSTAAVVDKSRNWSYAELDAAAQRIAIQLSQIGVSRGQVVPVGLNRSAEMMAVLLGIQRIGAGYAPLNPTDPEDRLGELLEELGADLVITEDATGPALSSFAGRRLRLHHELEIDASPPGESPPDVSAPDDVAYVIFTSGSTGRPKGVAVEQRAIVNTIAWRNEAFPLGPLDRVALTFSCIFDASAAAIFSTLSAGATLIIPPEGTERDPLQLSRWLAQHAVTVLQMTPSQLRLLLDGASGTLPASIRLVICGGEPMPTDLPLRIRQALRPANERAAAWQSDDAALNCENLPATEGPTAPLQIVNLYGPTECACDACFWVCRPDERSASVPIGRPIANVSAVVLDQQGRATPIGVPGELHLGGAGLARGYWNDPSRTAERFITRTDLSGRPRRLYRTGDRVRWRSDGTLEFLGRIDQQFKLQGYRIEPSEIERALRQHPLVRDAVVFVGPAAGGAERLCALLLDHVGSPRPTVEELRRLVRRKLPDYMTPTAWGWTESLPCAPTGKLDLRVALSLVSGSDVAVAVEPPQTRLEEYLAEQFQRMLRVDGVGREQSFFELGGSSIDAALLVNEVQQKLGEYVYTVALYDAPRISELARYLGEMYPEAVERHFGRESLPSSPDRAGAVADEARLAEFRQLIRVLPPAPEPSTAPNPPMVFLLSAPRSGSTLTRAMLGGHPKIFAPPELQLLNFRTLRERRAAFEDERDRFWLDGTVRALMELLSCDADAARDVMSQCEREDLSVKEFYRFVQERLGDRWFLDKTPMYALDPAVLERAERDFRVPRYIHLVRHPAAMQASFVKARLQVFFRPFLRAPHRFLPHEFAELVWTLSQRTILDFLKTVPQERQLRVRFEDLVRDPRGAMEQAAKFLGLAFDPAMLEPQADSQRRMTDPLAPLARMLGDVRFHEHQGIDRDAADRWQVDVGAALLGEPTWQIAEAFGYERPKSKSLARRPSPRDLLVPLQTPGTLPPIVWIHPPGGIVICYHALARLLGPDRPVFAVRGRGAHGEAPPHDSVEEMARDYVDEIVAGCPDGVVHLGGWSAGGVIALEVARQLRARGRDVGLVALLDSSIPVDTTQFPEDVSGLPPAVEYGLDISLVELARRPPSEQMEYILNHARQLGLVKPDTPLHLVKDTLDNLSRLFHAHVEAVQRYQLPADLGRITLFRPQEALSVEGARRDSGWSEFAAVGVRMVPGSHYTMVKEPHVRALAEQVNEALRLVERAARQSPASAAPRGNE